MASDSLRAVLRSLVDAGTIPGAVGLVADRKGLLAVEAAGYADLAARTPMRDDAFFWIASMTKPMAAAAFMALVDEGRASLDDAVAKFIPGFADLRVLRADGSLTPPRRPIVLRDLLSHTSGLRFLNTKDRNIIDSVPLAVSVEHDLLEPLLHDPGAAYLYSNEGIDTAGCVVEILSGTSFEGFLQERFFDPLGMRDTTFFPNAEQLSRLAKTYKPGPEGKGLVEMDPIPYLTQPLDAPHRYAAPGGGLFASGRDCVRFCQMLLGGGTFEGRRYLSPAAVAAMTTKQTGPEVETQYGLGLSTSPDGKTYGHSGALKTNMTVDHEQIRVLLLQLAEADGAPIQSAFEGVCRRAYPGAGQAAVGIEGSASSSPR
ncbi:MAG TPA: serine hydrolase domain-containing protein [Candidatus Methylacidiphilales bacterium]